MNWWQATILGIVQGLTEFIPVSSSGHLILSREFLGLGYGDFLWFDLLLHIATLLAIGLVFYKDIIKIFKLPFRIAGLIIIACIPAVIAGFFLSPLIRNVFYYSATYLWAFFLVTAILLLVSEMYEKRQSPKMFILDNFNAAKRLFSKRRREADRAVVSTNNSANDRGCWQAAKAVKHSEALVECSNRADGTHKDKKQDEPFLPDIKLKHALAMGLMQAVAVFPGISRSGSTIFGGVMSRGKRKSVAKFSFLMSIPIVLGAVLFDIVDIMGDSVPAAAAIPWYSYALGFLFSFVVGFFAIKFMIRLISKADFKWFALYMFGLSILTFVMFFLPAVR